MASSDAESEDASGSDDRSKYVHSERYKLCYIGFVGFFLVYAMRVNISVALVDMVNATESASHVVAGHYCPVTHSANQTQTDEGGPFNWSVKQQGYILSAFYYGYMVGQVPGGYLASRYGGKQVFGVGVVATGVLTLATPLFAQLGFGWLIALRVLMGVFEAGTFPAFNAMMGLWVPDEEKSSFSALATSGGMLGNIVTPAVVGALCSASFLDGWPLGFYLTGALAVLWYFGWYFLAYSSPKEHPRICPEEVRHLEKTVPRRAAAAAGVSPTIPWAKILTCRHVYGIVIAHTCVNYTTYGIMSVLPQYLADVQNFDISSNGFLSGLPWLCCFVSINVVANLTDLLKRRGTCSITVLRKANQLIGTVLPGACLVLAGYAGCNAALAVSFIMLGMTFFGFNWSAYNCNALDIAPLYAGVIFAISNTVATIPGFVAPVVADSITSSDIHNIDNWRIVFYIFAIVSTFGGVSYAVLGTAEVQPWGIADESPVESESALLIGADDNSSNSSGDR